jgi:hypothetical protein
MKNIILANQSKIAPKHESHGDYDYYKHLVVPKDGKGDPNTSARVFIF